MMIQEIYVVETLQFKPFSYTLTPVTMEGGYHSTLERAREAVQYLKPRMGLWVLLSSIPLDVSPEESVKKPVELYEYVEALRQFKPCLQAQTPIERLIFRRLNIPYQMNQPQYLMRKKGENSSGTSRSF